MRKWYVSYLVRASIHFNRLPIELFIFILSELLFPFQPAMAPLGPGRFPPVTWFKWHSPYSRRKWRKSTSPRGQRHDKPRFIMHTGRCRTRLAAPRVHKGGNIHQSSRLNKNEHRSINKTHLLCYCVQLYSVGLCVRVNII